MKLSKKQLNQYRDFVASHAASRKKQQADKFRESDFVAGAMCIYFFLQQQDEIPATWIFNPMDSY